MRPATLVRTEQLARRLDDPGWIIFDCRFTLPQSETGRQAYTAAHILGAAMPTWTPTSPRLFRPSVVAAIRRGEAVLGADALRAAYLEALGTTPPQPGIHLCGSGVSACHNLLAMEIAGLSDASALPRLLERIDHRSVAPNHQGGLTQNGNPR